jgi:tetratricopeptide (TPR) repeat protein
VAQTASVIGREFQYDVLGDVYEAPQAIDGAVSNLQRKELVREKSRLPRRVYLFKHVLTQETAYSSMLMSRRRDLHGKVGECLEQVEPGNVGEISRHFLEAKQEARALPYLVEAGDRAARTGAREEAAEYYSKAVDIVQRVDDHEMAKRAYEGMGKTMEFAMNVPGALESYNAMLAYGQAHGDVTIQVSALNKLSLIEAMMLGQFEQAETHLTAAEELARENEEVPGLIELYTVRCNMCAAVADFGNANKYLTEAAVLGRKMDNKDTTAYGLAHKSNMLIHMTEYEEGWQTALEGLTAAEEANNLERKAEILTYSVPMYHLRNGDISQAQETGVEGYRIASQIGTTYSPSTGAFLLGKISEMQGDYEGALEWFERSLGHARPLIDFVPFLAVMPMAGIGVTYLDISKKTADRVIELGAQALQLLETPYGAPAGGSGWPDLGFAALEMGKVEEAEKYFHNGLNSPSIQMYEMRPLSLVGACHVALELGKADEAKKYADEARTFAEERRMKCYYPIVSIAEAKVSAAHGDSEGALKRYKEAEALATEMGLRPMVLQARMGALAVLTGCGRASEAEALRNDVQAMVDEIAGLFKSEGYREMYMENASAKLETVI